MYEIDAVFKGLVPMMHDRFYNPADTEGPKKKQGPNAWKKELPLKAYVDKKKGVYIPADNIRMMLIGNKARRGAATILGSDMGSQKGTAYVSLCQGCIWVLGKDDPQRVYLEPKRKTFDDYDERTFMPAKGQRKLTRRPIMTVPWSLHFTIQVTDDSIEETFVRQLFDLAGLRCGVGAYGPTFGRCIIDKWHVMDGKKTK